ncbi:TPA: hypothetical protein ACF26R_004339 [Klebsiella quasipneumoniae subsp. similipneumoniae]
MTDITELALIKGQKVEAPYYLAECTECGKMYSSSKLIVSRNYFDGDADCYCPHCNADDADIADLGSGEQPAVMAWNYQQARIDVLVEALEKAQQHIARQEQILLNQDESLSIRRGELEAAQQERENWRTSFDNERFRADKLKAHIDEMTEERSASINELSRIIQKEVKAKREAEQRIAELEREQEHLRPVGVMSEKAFHRLENSECRFIALWPRPGIFLRRKRPEDGVIVYARTAAAAGIKVEAE